MSKHNIEKIGSNILGGGFVVYLASTHHYMGAALIGAGMAVEPVMSLFRKAKSEIVTVPPQREQNGASSQQENPGKTQAEINDDICAKLTPCKLPEKTDRESLDRFFTPEIMERIIYCPKTNVDALDDFGIFGTEPGFLLVQERRYPGIRCISDKLWLEGLLALQTAEKLSVPVIEYDCFPFKKLAVSKITPRRTPEIFEYLWAKVQTRRFEPSAPGNGKMIRNLPPSVEP